MSENFKRVGWLGSARLPSHIHGTIDEAETTVCGLYRPNDCAKEPMTWYGKETTRWVLREVPRKIRGRSRYCKTCFHNRRKTAPWFDPAAVYAFGDHS